MVPATIDPPEEGANHPQDHLVPQEHKQRNGASSSPMQHTVALPDTSCLHRVGPFAKPFLAVVMDPRAAGPHTFVALRALFRLLSNNAFQGFPISLEPLMKGVLQCRFEQTDAGADEAVEMAIADLLTLLVSLDSFASETLMDAFNTVFVTRNTFVHSPALCYHFEVVLTTLVQSVFKQRNSAAKLILEFLVNQLLHTPLSNGHSLDEAAREAQMAHDATRVLCLKLTRCCLSDWENVDTNHDNELIKIVQDDLCLSLLMTGQAIWSYAPGLVSMDVLSEVCATISALWNTDAFRNLLVDQFQTIFTGFYQRAVMLLRQRQNPVDSTTFNENLIFDAEVEVILESLVDLLCIQEQEAPYSASTLETLFMNYDCNLVKSDVAEHLVVELAKCCGAIVSDDGEAALDVCDIVDKGRPVPPHLKELCAEALLGCLRALFRTATPLNNPFQDAPPDLDLAAPMEQTDGKLPTVNMDALSNVSHRTIKSRKRQFRKAAKLFNESASKGVDLLVKLGLIQESPLDVASFLRHGVVFGLDKAAVGQYLGELGKAPSAGKSPPCWERDWFHKEVLTEYCSLFRFENQSLLEGLRMFLACFRLPGEGQQIDRIVQAFADSCGRKCDEATKLQLFSSDPKRASDTAFLLAYSIIMLNTDQHNPHIREDKKMSIDAFVRNNSDYGKDITEKGKELPRDFLEFIYESIREEQIRTEGEGAQGHMTVERWKDVLRGSTVTMSNEVPENDYADLKELVVETIWMPIVSAVGAFWAVIRPKRHLGLSTADPNQSGMLGAQGARLGMDIALEILTGVRKSGRTDIFRHAFSTICGYSGLLGPYSTDAVQRMSSFVHSVEAQSAVIVCISVANEATDDLGVEGWMLIWAMIFELRDLGLLRGVNAGSHLSILVESDADLLDDGSRREWNLKLSKGSFDVTKNSETPRSFFGAMGRALFGSEITPEKPREPSFTDEPMYSIHGKDELLLWDEVAVSDDEESMGESSDDEGCTIPRFSSMGSRFESQLIQEDILLRRQEDTPVTGLERVEENGSYHISPRARVRRRLRRTCDLSGLINESRFMEINGTITLIDALSRVIKVARTDTERPRRFEDYTLSPASEALAEVLLCEISMKNKDRLSSLWSSVLKDHYSQRLNALSQARNKQRGIAFVEPGVEKCVTGLLRLSSCASQKEEMADEVITSLCSLVAENTQREIEELDKHVGEGILRICSNVNGLPVLTEQGWRGLLRLVAWCAARTGRGTVQWSGGENRSSGLADDDPGLKAYKSLHILVNIEENRLSSSIATTIEELIMATERSGCSKLCLAALDLLDSLQSGLASHLRSSGGGCDENMDGEAVASWEVVMQVIAKTARESKNPVSNIIYINPPRFYWHADNSPLMSQVVRLHALSILTDAFLDKKGSSISLQALSTVLPNVCIRFAAERLSWILSEEGLVDISTEDIMIESEQCIGLIFRPFLHHSKRLACYPDNSHLTLVWSAVLAAMESVLQSDAEVAVAGGESSTLVQDLRAPLKELACEHLRNAIMVLHAVGALKGDSDISGEMSSLTWASVSRMSFCTGYISEWKDSTSS
jgi:hypothetical protein